MQDQNIEIIDTDDEQQQLALCQRYLLLREPDLSNDGRVLTMQEVADSFGRSRATLYTWVNRWKASGIMTTARSQLVKAKQEELDVAKNTVLTQTPAMMKRLVGIVLSERSDKNSIDAYRTLWETVIGKEIDKAQGDSAGEIEYLRRSLGDQKFNKPTDI